MNDNLDPATGEANPFYLVITSGDSGQGVIKFYTVADSRQGGPITEMTGIEMDSSNAKVSNFCPTRILPSVEKFSTIEV